jgi:cyclase
MEIFERPARYAGPDLDPTAIRFHSRTFAKGVYALMASPMPRDNSGLIVGRDAALMIDAGINGDAARKAQELARKLTDVPIKYLVNTNYHGDHTFGNYAFPEDVEIVAHELTVKGMQDFEYEKRIRARNLFGHEDAIADVNVWRKPTRVFSGERMDMDLGGRRVQLWHLGGANTPGDTIVYEPETRVAWTGNMIGNERLIVMLLEPSAREYMDTLARVKAKLDICYIVPGHGPIGHPVSFDRTIRYLWGLLQDVTAAYEAGLSVEAAVEAVELRKEFKLPFYMPSSLDRLMKNFQRLNVLSTYRQLEKEQHLRRAA